MTRAMHLQQVKNRARYFKPKSSEAVKSALASRLAQDVPPIHIVTPTINEADADPSYEDWLQIHGAPAVVGLPPTRLTWGGVTTLLILALVACAFAAYWWT